MLNQQSIINTSALLQPQKWLLLIVLILVTTTISTAQTQYRSTTKPRSVSVIGIPMTRVIDPWSSSTIWLDEHQSHAIDLSTPSSPMPETIRFYFENAITIFEHDYMDNARSIAELDKIFSSPAMQQGNTITVVTGAASPEGTLDFNLELASNRALAIKSFIMWKYPHLDRDKISTYSLGEDWAGFRRMVDADYKIPGRKKVIEILNLDLTDDQKRERLRKVNNGDTYRYLKANIFPHLRGGVTCTFYTIQEPQPVIEYRDRLRIDTVYLKEPIAFKLKPIDSVGYKKPRYVALKTNLLYDAILLPNIALELSLGQRWSIEGEWMHSWWGPIATAHYYHRIQLGSLELRKWLGDPGQTPLTGVFIGGYVMGGTYDYKLGEGQGSLSDASYSVGGTIGYSKPLGRRVNLEFALGIGYFGGEFKNYVYDPDHDRYPWVETLNRSYFGPTKAKVSLVWLIGSGVNKR